MSKENTRATILRDLEEIYVLALEKGNLMVALRAKELLGKGAGLFASPSSQKKVSLGDLSDEDLERLIQEITAVIPHEKEI